MIDIYDIINIDEHELSIKGEVNYILSNFMFDNVTLGHANCKDTKQCISNLITSLLAHVVSNNLDETFVIQELDNHLENCSISFRCSEKSHNITHNRELVKRSIKAIYNKLSHYTPMSLDMYKIEVVSVKLIAKSITIKCYLEKVPNYRYLTGIY